MTDKNKEVEGKTSKGPQNMIFYKVGIMIIFALALSGWLGYGYNLHVIGTLLEKDKASAVENEKLRGIIAELTRDKKDCLKKVATPARRNVEDMKSYITWRYPNVPVELASIIAETTQKTVTEHEMDFGLVTGLMDVESAFNPFAKSKVGARGLMQVMFKTWGKEYNIKKPSDLHDIAYNIDIGVQILKHYLEKNKGDIRKALQNYNGSKGTEFSNRVYIALGQFTAYRNNNMAVDKPTNSNINKKEIVDKQT